MSLLALEVQTLTTSYFLFDNTGAPWKQPSMPIIRPSDCEILLNVYFPHLTYEGQINLDPPTACTAVWMNALGL